MEDIDAKYKKAQIIIDYFFVIASIITIAVGFFYASVNFSAIGLTLDLSGFLLIFGFGLPSRFATAWDPSTRIHFAKILSWMGVGLVISGFIFQYLSSISVNF